MFLIPFGVADRKKVEWIYTHPTFSSRSPFSFDNLLYITL